MRPPENNSLAENVLGSFPGPAGKATEPSLYKSPKEEAKKKGGWQFWK